MALPRPGDVEIKDLAGRDPRTVHRQETLHSLSARLDPGTLGRRAAARLRGMGGRVPALGKIPVANFLPAPILVAAVGLLLANHSALAYPLFLAAFGYGLLMLLLAALPGVERGLRAMPGVLRWPLGVLAWGLCASLGLFSPLLVGVVLVLGGYTTARVLRSLLVRLMGWLSPRPRAGIAEAQVDPRPLLGFGAMVAVASLSLSLGLLWSRPPGEIVFVLAGLDGGLVMGMVPTDWKLLRSLRLPGLDRWRIRWSRGLARDVLIAATVAALMGHEAYLAVGGAAAGLSPSSLALVFLSYFLICTRQVPRWGGLLGRPRPHLLLSLGFVLACAPFLVFLASPSGVLTQVYGVAEALGLALGLAMSMVNPQRMQRMPAWLQRLLGP